MPWEKKEQIQRPVKQRKQVAPLNVVLGHVIRTVIISRNAVAKEKKEQIKKPV